MKSFCEYYNQNICRSCTQIELTYPEQIRSKEQILKDALWGLYSEALLPSVVSVSTGFRNKAKLSVTGTIETPIVGLLGEEDLDAGREILDCPLHHPELNRLAHALIPFIRICLLTPYNIQEKKGEIKGIILFHSPDTSESYVRLVLRSKESIDRIKKHLSNWLEGNPGVKCFSVNIQPIAHAILEGDEEIILTTSDHMNVNFAGNRIGISPQGFVQTNQAVAKQLYAEAENWIKSIGARKFLELYSGQGAFSFHVQENVTVAVGIEINTEAVRRANQTARSLRMAHLSFIALDAKDMENEVKKLAPDVILVNPPRRGLGPGISTLKNCGVPYLIYSSCSVDSLRKDLQDLREKYEVVKVRLFDMFPNSTHFETLVLLKLSVS